jgi:hypothetical protein
MVSLYNGPMPSGEGMPATEPSGEPGSKVEEVD